MSKQNRAYKSKKKKIRRRIFLILVPIVIALLAVVSYGTYLYNKADSVISESYVEDEREKSPLREAMVDPTIDNVSILIMGVDENDHRENVDGSRTDALMVATFNKDDHSINILSIPRDSLVYIPEVGYEDKINHAHAFGGASATIDTVENLLDIPIDYWVRVNFHAFVDVVDALDGITAEVPYEFKESDSMDKRDTIHLKEGIQTLDGEEALALARTRKLDNDIQRGKRQQEIITSIIEKATSVGSVLNYDDVLEAVGDNMTTNMTFSDMRTFITYGTSGGSLDINTATLEGTDYQPAGIYYWQIDPFALDETKLLLQDHLEIEPTLVHEEPYQSEHDDGAITEGVAEPY